MEILSDATAMTRWSRARRAEGLALGFVPTMGFLHAGHTSLMDIAGNRADRLVVSIYVNPLQFGPGEDLARYPRDLEGDLARCRAHGVSAVFLPESLYEPGFCTTVAVAGPSRGLCGATRPGHFDGVATVVARLFGLVQPRVAVFGEKDWQQLAVVRRMVRDLAMEVEIVGGPLIRDADGLALSSRNRYLAPADRARALSLSRALFAMQASGIVEAKALCALGRGLLDVDALDYLEVVCAESLTPLEVLDRPARALVAARVGGTRLIDNAPLEPVS
ncbi:MAG: pantoate--beta-alanine ligase [Pseudomonadota bacterium]